MRVNKLKPQEVQPHDGLFLQCGSFQRSRQVQKWLRRLLDNEDVRKKYEADAE